MKYFITLILIALVYVAWCPWFTADQAMSLVDTKVAQLQESNPNLCALSIDKTSISKVPFGYTEKISYNCGVNDPVYGVTQSTNVAFIAFNKEIWGIPNQTIQGQEND